MNEKGHTFRQVLMPLEATMKFIIVYLLQLSGGISVCLDTS